MTPITRDGSIDDAAIIAEDIGVVDSEIPPGGSGGGPDCDLPSSRPELSESTRQSVRSKVRFFIGFNALFALFLAIKPGSPTFIRAVDDIAQALGPAITLPWFL